MLHYFLVRIYHMKTAKYINIISLKCQTTVSKIVVRLVPASATYAVESSNYYPLQSTLRDNRSTETALVMIMNASSEASSAAPS